MKKVLLLSLFGASVLGMSAENKIFFPESPDGETLGYVTAISGNGRYATILDDENNLSYLWDYINPLELVQLPGKCQAFDVTNDGMVVGCTYASGKYTPAIYRNGEWTALPVDPTSLNTNFVRRTTDDGKVLGGIQCIKDDNNEMAKGYRACKWTLNEDGQYELSMYESLPPDVAHHQGFWMLDMNNDGSIFTGYIMCGATQCTIPAIVKDGRYDYFVEVEERLEPWYYKGELQGYEKEYYIDGYHDTEDQNNFQGAFNTIVDGICYGSRTQAIDVTPEGTGKLIRGACTYDINKNEWTDNYDYDAFPIGMGDKIFTSHAKVLINGEAKSLADAFDIKYSQDLVCVQELNSDGTVMGGMHQELNPATMEYMYYPFIIALDYNPEKGVKTVSDANISIVAENGLIKVNGAENIAIYSIDGKFVSNSAETAVDGGLYIVRADNVVRKVIVK